MPKNLFGVFLREMNVMEKLQGREQLLEKRGKAGLLLKRGRYRGANEPTAWVVLRNRHRTCLGEHGKVKLN